MALMRMVSGEIARYDPDHGCAFLRAQRLKRGVDPSASPPLVAHVARSVVHASQTNGVGGRNKDDPETAAGKETVSGGKVMLSGKARR